MVAEVPPGHVNGCAVCLHGTSICNVWRACKSSMHPNTM